jgi:hypothetical protein
VAVAPAAGAAVELSYVAVGLLAALAFVVCVGLRVSWEHTLGYILDEIASVRLPLGIGHPFGFLNAVNKTVLNSLAIAATKSEHAMGYMFHGAAVILGWMARETVGLARDVYGWMEWFQHTHLPRWVKALIYATVPALLLPRVAKLLHGVHPTQLTRIIERRIGLTRRQVKAMIAAALATAGAVTLPLPHVLPRLRRLEHGLSIDRKRLRRLEKLLGATGAAVLVARALGVGSWRCIKDGNIGRAARAVCGWPTWLLDGLLAGLVVLQLPFSIQAFAEDALAIEDDIVSFITSAIEELG